MSFDIRSTCSLMVALLMSAWIEIEYISIIK